jgi:hypothetical protein
MVSLLQDFSELGYPTMPYEASRGAWGLAAPTLFLSYGTAYYSHGTSDSLTGGGEAEGVVGRALARRQEVAPSPTSVRN